MQRFNVQLESWSSRLSLTHESKIEKQNKTKTDKLIKSENGHNVREISPKGEGYSGGQDLRKGKF